MISVRLTMDQTPDTYPGGFVRTTILSKKFKQIDPRCVRCLRARRLVCDRCMGGADGPWSEDGRRGEFFGQLCEGSA